MTPPFLLTAALLAAATPAFAAEIHVATSGGNDAAEGSATRPLKTISAAAQKAMPGDTVTVHAGVYRERVNPPRGGESDTRRIVYRAAPGEKVVITGSESAKGWTKVAGDVWKLTLPNKTFGNFNPYADKIFGDWFNGKGRVHHTGCVYLNGDWMIEAVSLGQVMKPSGKTPLWFASVDGADDRPLMSLAGIKTPAGAEIPGGEPAYRYGGKPAAGPGGGRSSGGIRHGHWLRFDGVDFGAAGDSVTLRASAQRGVVVELRLDHPGGELLGECAITATGDAKSAQEFSAKIKPVSGKRSLCLVFKDARYDAGSTTIHAQFPGGVDPNAAPVEINARQTVFYPSKNRIDWITVRGFTLLNAATNWAAPSSEQTGVAGTNWSKGWIIEDNEIAYSKCCGVSLGKYGDNTDNTNDAGAADPYTACVKRALANGWDKATVGGHIVRRNHIHHCEQTGVVGSLGCAFSVVEGNDIHDTWTRKLFGGWEPAAVKFHGFVDGVVRDNHIHDNGGYGLWFDWMAQGSQVTGNLFHANGTNDIYCEMQHGPMLIAGNLLLSESGILFHSEGIAFAHNLAAGEINSHPHDARRTPFLKAHSTEIAGILDSPSGDHRLHNNLFVGKHGHSRGGSLDTAKLPCFADGNVFAAGATPTKFDTGALVKPDFDPKVKLTQKPDGWYLALNEDGNWKSTTTPRRLVTTKLLGLAKVANLPYENADGSPLAVDTDYFGKKRDASNPFPGPFETPVNGEVKVWPK